MLEIESVKFFKQFVILKFKGFDNINDIEKYKTKSLYVTRANAVRLRKDEYFIADLPGVNVYTEEGETLGKLEDIFNTGSNDIYVVKAEDGKQLLLPAISEVIKEINLKENKIVVHLLEGLR